jgi:hypothetical protein
MDKNASLLTVPEVAAPEREPLDYPASGLQRRALGGSDRVTEGVVRSRRSQRARSLVVRRPSKPPACRGGLAMSLLKRKPQREPTQYDREKAWCRQ